jgi:hypothetical protein
MAGVLDQLKPYALAAAVLALAACSLFSPPVLSISAANPSEAVAGSDTDVWVEFSIGVDQTKAEAATSLSEAGQQLDLRYRWEGQRLHVLPVHGLKTGVEYLLRVVTSVETPDGVNLDHEYRHEFRTSADQERPTVSVTAPAKDAVSSDRRQSISLEFSEAVDRSSFYDAFTVSPSNSFSWEWSQGDTLVTGTPRQDWDWQRDCTVKLSTGLKDLAGNCLAEALSMGFRIGEKLDKPSVASVSSLLPPVDVAGDWTLGVLAFAASESDRGVLDATAGMEANWGIELVFDQAVAREGLESLISVSPSWDYRLEATGDWVESVRLIPQARLVHGTGYELKVAKGLSGVSGVASTEGGLWRFTVDGAATRPPGVDSLRLRLDPAAGSGEGNWFVLKGDHSDDFSTLVLPVSEFPVNSATVTWIDVRFSLAEGAVIDPVALMAAFDLCATNSCLTAVILAVQTVGSDVARIWLRLTPATSSGLVSFNLAKGLADSLGNATTQAMVWAVNK